MPKSPDLLCWDRWGVSYELVRRKTKGKTQKNMMKRFFIDVLLIPAIALIISLLMLYLFWGFGDMNTMSEVEQALMGAGSAVVGVLVGCIILYNIKTSKRG